jgi:Raf kinase inhibitor-like YbhB/YbcL family protein
MKLSSPVFDHKGSIPRKYTCQGVDISPPLTLTDISLEAKSLALIMDDPDVPKHIRPDGWFIHWVVYNIDPKTRIIQEGTPSLGVLGQNTAGTNRYMGPCPPDRQHRYFFRLYALDTMLKLSAGATKDELLKAMQGHILAECELMGFYEKS